MIDPFENKILLVNAVWGKHPLGNLTFIQDFTDAFARLNSVWNPVAKSLQDFEDFYLMVANRQYRSIHKKLPGSDRTARLRKKRKAVVLRWMGTQLKAIHREGDKWQIMVAQNDS